MNTENAVLDPTEDVPDGPDTVDAELLVEPLIEEISIDGMCGVY